MKQGNHLCGHAVRHVPTDEGPHGVSPAGVRRGRVSAQRRLRLQMGGFEGYDQMEKFSNHTKKVDSLRKREAQLHQEKKNHFTHMPSGN